MGIGWYQSATNYMLIYFNLSPALPLSSNTAKFRRDELLETVTLQTLEKPQKKKKEKKEKVLQ